jgi:hypothetical protein
LHQINVIDAMGFDEASGRVTLVIRHDEPWDGSDAQLYLLQEKLNAYLSFALDGEMAETSPEFVDKHLAVLIETKSTPDKQTLRMLAHVREQIAFQDITLAVRVAGPSEGGAGEGCGEGCGCH